MKTIKNIIRVLKNINDFLFLKITAITYMAVSILLAFFFGESMKVDSHSSIMQFMIGIFLIVIPIICFLLVVNINATTKFWRRINYTFILICLLIGGGLLYDLSKRPTQYRPLSIKVSVVNTDFNNDSINDLGKTLIEVDTRMYMVDSVNVIKCDSSNLLNLYLSYKIDIFGDTTCVSKCIKSNLMNNYQYLYNGLY